MKIESALYLSATPIGNMEDITLRTLRVLRAADAIYCEDTRHSATLLAKYAIRKPLFSCHEHNENARAEEIAARVARGEVVAYISDAGLPGISDPGERLVSYCIANGVPFTVLPGASAMPTALVLSGLPTQGACFLGFVPRETKPRRELLTAYASHRGALIFYESPLRLSATAKELRDALGNRRCALCRELTKLHEEVVRCTLDELAERYASEPPRGECVLVVEGEAETANEKQDAEALAREYIASGMSVKDAVKKLSAIADIARNEAYKLVSEIAAKTE